MHFYFYFLEDPKTRILWAAEHGRLDMVKELVEKDPELIKSVDEDLYTPLHRAAYNNHVDIVKVCKFLRFYCNFYFIFF